MRLSPFLNISDRCLCFILRDKSICIIWVLGLELGFSNSTTLLFSSFIFPTYDVFHLFGVIIKISPARLKTMVNLLLLKWSCTIWPSALMTGSAMRPCNTSGNSWHRCTVAGASAQSWWSKPLASDGVRTREDLVSRWS